ncbi:class I SAM-dependent methyltransferase [Clostridium estertheticum]|uniref:class I SAM-dependent methyltransferase n=1 Tax=Clostridium estertheticum TaxID=238834 RepID=UPI001C6F068A|nr:class I SAM-dependent methyltransferase [Clostridium estertheticum]MBW9172757.1 class I SAM-dependent methyltransferase [Clostridium estertheticum]WLC77709.1 class I SAM-dependent methyltransferase [Clostridium estertheticum]
MNSTSIRAVMLNIRAKKDSSQVIKSLEIKKGNTIADIGSGGGYFTFKFSKIIGTDGKVFAVDTNQKFLSHINKILKRDKIQNIKIVISNENRCPLSNISYDLIFMRNVFHHITSPVNYFKNIKNCIKPGCKIAIIEWLPTNMKWRYVGFPGHCTQENEIQKIMLDAGFMHLKSFNFLKRESFNIFQKQSL